MNLLRVVASAYHAGASVRGVVFPFCVLDEVCKEKHGVVCVSSQTACHPTRAQPSVPHNAPANKSLTTCTPHDATTTNTCSAQQQAHFSHVQPRLHRLLSPVWRLLHTHSGAKMFAAITRAKLFAPIVHYHVVEGERTRPGVSSNGLTCAPAECGRAWTWPAFCCQPHELGRNLEVRRRPVASVWS